MPHQTTRRNFVLLTAASTSALAAGCGKEVTDAVGTATTETVQNSKLALRGYQIVAYKLGETLIHTPHPVTRIIGVFIAFSATAAELVIEYLDDELERRHIRETLSEQQRILVEQHRSVTFLTENGAEEHVALGDNQYAE